MLPYPLTRPNRLQLARAFARVPRVDISIECVLEDQMGKAFVDSVENPQHFMIELDGFFGYLAGDLTSAAGRDFVCHLPAGRMYMSGSPGWQEALQAVFGDRARPIKRYRFASDSLSMDYLKSLASDNPNTPNVQRVDAAFASTNPPYLEIGGFESADDFVARGIGYCMVKEGKVLGAAYSSLVCSDAIEVSIVVDPEHYRQGIAAALSSQLLLWCLEHDVAPHWDAANEESCGLAEKLGYTPEGEYVAYFLK